MNALRRRSYLGFEVTAEGPDDAPRWIVSEIDVGSPAAEAGLLLGDEVTSLAGTRLESLAALRRRAATLGPGERAELSLRRGSTLLSLALEPSPMPPEPLKTGRVVLDEVPWAAPGLGTIRLRAIWTIPEGAGPNGVGPHPAVWILPGAAWISQETPLDTWDPTYQLVEALTAAGLATLRVDRSGLGDSEGPPCTDLDLEQELSMWETARAAFLASPRVSRGRHFIYGRSLGGILAPLVAQDQPFAGIAVWGTTAGGWHEASLASAAYQYRLRGVRGAELEHILERIAALQSLVYLEGLTPAEAYARAPELADVMPEAFRGELVHDRTARFFQQLAHMDVAAAWSRVRCPVLAVHAEYDTLTQAEDLQRIVELCGGGGRFVELAGVDHFMHARQSLEEAVRVPWGGEFDPEAARLLKDFFLERIS